MAAKILPDVAYLRECFTYDPKTGVLIWKHRPREHFRSDLVWRGFIANFSGNPAGGSSDRYIRIVLDNKYRLYGHRIIWAMQTGEWPNGEIDHKNQNKLDNHWENLRLATRPENMRNRPGWDKSLLPKGVTRHRRRYIAQSSIGGCRVYLGLFETPEEAHKAYCAYASSHHGEFFSPGKK